MKLTYRYGVLALGVFLAGFLGLRAFMNDPSSDSPLLNIHTSTPSVTVTASRTPSPLATPTPSSSSGTRVVLSVPFTSQAPHGVWDEFHQHTCEEATLVMAHAWVKGLALTPDYAEAELQKLGKWGVDNLGTYVDSDARQTARMGEAVYGFKTKIIDQPSVQDIKDEINAGNIVIMGMAGRMLGNPNYTPPGPLYHMLLVKGYDATGFITNDDGTRNGNSYHYSFSTFMAAAHDWDGDAAGLTSNPAVAFTVSKN